MQESSRTKKSSVLILIMSHQNIHSFDSRGDITFVLQGRFKESRRGSSFLYHKTPAKDSSIYMKTSSRCLQKSSPVFKAMLKPNFPEGATLLFTGRVEVPLPDDDPVAFAILMDIVHGKASVPRQVSLSLLTSLSVLVDKYQLQKVASRYSNQWVDNIKRDIPQSITPDIFHWLSVSWVFQATEEFNHVTRILERESNGLDLDTYSKELNEYLPVPQIVTETISRKRQRAIQYSFDMLNSWTDILQMPKTRCNSKAPESHRLTCDAKLLDSLLVSATKIGIWPPPPAPFNGLTFKDVAHDISQLDVVSFCSRTAYTSATSRSHGIKADIGSAMQKIQNKLSGLNLKDFSRYAPNPKLCDEFGRKGSG